MSSTDEVLENGGALAEAIRKLKREKDQVEASWRRIKTVLVLSLAANAVLISITLVLL